MRIIGANIISSIGAVFLCLATLEKDVKKIYLFQAFECLALFLSQAILGQIAGALSMLFGIARNLLIVKNKYSMPYALTFFALTALFGIKFNTGGTVGLIPVIAALIYILTSKIARNVVFVKFALLLNLVLWVIYSFLIKDYVTFFVNLFCSIFSPQLNYSSAFLSFDESFTS